MKEKTDTVQIVKPPVTEIKNDTAKVLSNQPINTDDYSFDDVKKDTLAKPVVVPGEKPLNTDDYVFDLRRISRTSWKFEVPLLNNR